MSKKSILICDECGANSGTTYVKGFPYKQGWVYIYGMNLKFGENDKRQMQDKHFCKKECMLSHINNFIINGKPKEKDVTGN